MQYNLSPRIKMGALIMIALGVVLYAVGYFMHSTDDVNGLVENYIKEHPDMVYGENPSAEFMAIAHQEAEHKEHVHHMENQYKNRPWAAFYVPSFLFFGIAGAALFFLSIQFAANAGWSIIISRVMEAMATYIPIGGAFIAIVLIGAALHGNHMFHWMDEKFYVFGGEHFDKYLAGKRNWLNTPFWLVRAGIVWALWSVFMIWIKKTTKKLDETKDDPELNRKWHSKLYTRSVLFIAVFALTSAYLAWDWIMSLDPHWFSTLFMWYAMVSYLVSAVSIMAMISIYLRKKGALPDFNDNHLHDLAKYMFGFSFLWTYLWFCQFMLIWYANIPEEVQYFQQRFSQNPWYLTMLIVNFFLVFVIMISSSIKRRFKLVMAMGLLIVLGHYYDIFNMVMPATVGAFWGIGPMEIGALLFVAGVFILVVFRELSKLNLRPEGHPYFHESKIYEYPF